MVELVQSREYDALIGMNAFTTKSEGIGGRLRKTPEDFIVQEIGLDGSIAPLESLEKEYADQPGKFTVFFLVKRNIDSIQAIRHLSKSVGASYKRFSYAGMKDRRAVTSQRVSFRGAPHELIGRDGAHFSILHPHRVAKPIVPGALKGNRFRIVVREVPVEPQEATLRVNEIRREIAETQGVLNYFGPQRFGVIRPNTHLVGKQIVLENYEQAVQILLKDKQPSDQDEESHLTVPESPQGTYERAITHYLNKHPGEFKKSFQVLPKDLVRLYVHAYQSYLFNLAISERRNREIPLQEPIIGDFIMPPSGEIHTVRPVTKNSLEKAQENVRKGKQRLVMPVIGFDFEHVHFEGQLGEIYQSILDSESISPGQFRLTELPALSSRGTFRPLLVNPEKIQIAVIEEAEDTPVRIEFDLPKGSYASVILREFIKPDMPTQL